MEQDVPILEDSPRTRSSRGYAKSSIASHGASFSTHPTTQDMDHLSIMLQRLDSQDIQLCEIQGQLTYIISQIFHLSLCIFVDMDYFYSLLILCIQNEIDILYIYIECSFFSLSLVCFLAFIFLLLSHFCIKMEEKIEYLTLLIFLKKMESS